MTSLNALAEHVNQKIKALENQKHTVERAVVESNRLNEMIWSMEVQISKLNETVRRRAAPRRSWNASKSCHAKSRHSSTPRPRSATALARRPGAGWKKTGHARRFRAHQHGPARRRTKEFDGVRPAREGAADVDDDAKKTMEALVRGEGWLPRWPSAWTSWRSRCSHERDAR